MKTLILGAGYAGLGTVSDLKPTPGLDVTLVERNPYHTIETRLHEAAAHNAEVTVPLEPLLTGKGVKLERSKIESVDLDRREVMLEGGRALTYDTLVVGLGSVTNFYKIPGLAEHASELKTLEDAREVFAFVNRAFAADFQGNRDIVVGGAGLTGVELITELAKRSEALSHETGKPPLNLYLVEAGPKILPVIDEKLRQEAQRVMDSYGIKTLIGHKLMKAEAGSVTVQTADGQDRVIEAGKTVWTGGIMPREILKGEKIEKGPGGRIVVDEYLRAKNYPEVFVLGDMGLGLNTDGKPVPTTAQHAGQQGHLTARNLMHLAQKQALEVYVPETQGEFVSLGGLMGVGWMKLPMNKKLALTGGPAFAMKKASELRWRLSIN